MKNIISNLIKYILVNYPYKSELSASRLTKILYLADWKSSIEKDSQITSATWHFHHYGPYVDDFLKIAKEDSDINVVNTATMFGGKKQQIELNKDFNSDIEVSHENKEILDFVIEATKDKNYEDFIKLVYSTYPVISSNRYSDFDLVAMARDYKSLADSTNKQGQPDA
jgi:Antitoxin SocA-like, Panacea domain